MGIAFGLQVAMAVHCRDTEIMQTSPTAYRNTHYSRKIKLVNEIYTHTFISIVVPLMLYAYSCKQIHCAGFCSKCDMEPPTENTYLTATAMLLSRRKSVCDTFWETLCIDLTCCLA